MIPKRCELLREWSLQLCGHTQICSPDCDKYPTPYVRDKNGKEFSWQPESEDAPASQILGFIEAMRELGWRLHLLYPSFMSPDKVSAGFGRIEKNWPQKYTKADTLPLAVLMAAKDALTSQNPSP